MHAPAHLSRTALEAAPGYCSAEAFKVLRVLVARWDIQIGAEFWQRLIRYICELVLCDLTVQLDFL